MDLRVVLEDLDGWKPVSADDYSDAEDNVFKDDLLRIEMGNGALHYYIREHDEEN